MKIDRSLARNIDFEETKKKKTRRKTPILRRRKCQNWRKSRAKCSFCCAHVPRLECLVFPVASPCLWGKLQNISFSKVSKQVVMSFCVAGAAFCDIPTCLITCRKCQIGGSLARNVRFSAPMCLVSSLWFSCGVAVPMGKLHTPHSTLYAPLRV